MTDHPDRPTHDDTAVTEPVEPVAAEPTTVTTSDAEPTAEPKRSRWTRIRPQGRLARVAALVVSAAAAIVIVGSIFVAGFAVGSEGGGHHGHGGDGNSHSESEGGQHQDGHGADGARDQGSGRDAPAQGDSGHDGSNDDGGAGNG